MSIVTLKKKSHATHFKVSQNKVFNINGVRPQRSSSFVGGSSSFNNTINKTPFKGTHPKGHGTCCGKYKNNIIKSNYSCHGDINNKTAIKSVKNTKGYLYGKTIWIYHGYPKFVVQPQSKSDYDTYYSKLTNCNGCKNNQNNDSGNCKSDGFSDDYKKCSASKLPNNMSNIKKNVMVYNYSKQPKTMTQGEYIQSYYKCNKCIPPPPEKREFPPAVNNSGCNVVISSHQEAINMGLYN